MLYLMSTRITTNQILIWIQFRITTNQIEWSRDKQSLLTQKVKAHTRNVKMRLLYIYDIERK